MSGETFEALLATNLPAVRKLVHTRLRMPDHADDIIQQTLLRAFARRDQLRVRAKFKSWLWSIALNEIRMFFRRDRGTVSLEEFPQIDSRDRGLSPLARFEEIERRDWLQAAMAKLSERDRAAIRLRDLDEPLADRDGGGARTVRGGGQVDSLSGAPAAGLRPPRGSWTGKFGAARNPVLPTQRHPWTDDGPGGASHAVSPTRRQRCQHRFSHCPLSCSAPGPADAQATGGNSLGARVNAELWSHQPGFRGADAGIAQHGEAFEVFAEVRPVAPLETAWHTIFHLAQQ